MVGLNIVLPPVRPQLAVLLLPVSAVEVSLSGWIGVLNYELWQQSHPVTELQRQKARNLRPPNNFTQNCTRIQNILLLSRPGHLHFHLQTQNKDCSSQFRIPRTKPAHILYAVVAVDDLGCRRGVCKLFLDLLTFDILERQGWDCSSSKVFWYTVISIVSSCCKAFGQ